MDVCYKESYVMIMIDLHILAMSSDQMTQARRNLSMLCLSGLHPFEHSAVMVLKGQTVAV